MTIGRAECRNGETLVPKGGTFAGYHLFLKSQKDNPGGYFAQT